MAGRVVRPLVEYSLHVVGSGKREWSERGMGCLAHCWVLRHQVAMVCDRHDRWVVVGWVFLVLLWPGFTLVWGGGVGGVVV